MRGAQLTINLASGQATLGGGVKSTTPGAQGNERVQAVFTPNSAWQLPEPIDQISNSSFLKHKQAWFLPMTDSEATKTMTDQSGRN